MRVVDSAKICEGGGNGREERRQGCKGYGGRTLAFFPKIQKYTDSLQRLRGLQQHS